MLGCGGLLHEDCGLVLCRFLADTVVVGAFRIVCSKVQTEFLTTKAEVLLPLLTKCTECVPQQYRLPILPIVQQ